jgi:hypothetical protein
MVDEHLCEDRGHTYIKATVTIVHEANLTKNTPRQEVNSCGRRGSNNALKGVNDDRNDVRHCGDGRNVAIQCSRMIALC